MSYDSILKYESWNILLFSAAFYDIHTIKTSGGKKEKPSVYAQYLHFTQGASWGRSIIKPNDDPIKLGYVTIILLHLALHAPVLIRSVRDHFFCTLEHLC